MNFGILIIDMINDYLHPDGKDYCEECREIIPNIKKLLGFSRENDIPVIYVNTSLLSENDPIVKKWGFHPIRGSWESEVIDELKPEKGDIIILKRSYDGFFSTELELTLRSLNIDTVVLVGIHTHVCVLLTGVSAFDRGFNVILLEDCVSTNNELYHSLGVEYFEKHIGDVMKLDDFIKMVESEKNINLG